MSPRSLSLIFLWWIAGPLWAGEHISREDFFRNPEQSSFMISPDGLRVAFLKVWEGHLNLFVKKLGTSDEVRLSADRNRDIGEFYWKGSGLVLYRLAKKGDRGGPLFAVPTIGGSSRNLTPFSGVDVRLENILSPDEQHVLISMNRRDPKVFDLHRLNVVTGQVDEVERNPGDVTQWLIDDNGNVQGAVRWDGRQEIYLSRKSVQAAWKDGAKVPLHEFLKCTNFTEDLKSLYCLSTMGRDQRALVLFDPTTGNERKVLFSPPEGELTTVQYSDLHHRVMGVSWEGEQMDHHFFDHHWQEVYATIRQQLLGYQFEVLSKSKDESRLTLKAFSAQLPGRFYWYDVKSRTLNLLADAAPWLKEVDLAPVKPIRFQARDGLMIQGYLTLPRYVDRHNLPVVIQIHDGPWQRDYGKFNPEVQFLANRGYAVFQMNYRGSSGFGKAFMERGNKEWGRRIQNDIKDGSQWLVTAGIADPRRICLYGKGFGGYSVLMGVILFPESYACGVDVMGPSNLFSYLEGIPSVLESQREKIYEKVGHPLKDQDLLRAVSPFFLSNKIKTPLMIVQAVHDRQVKKEEVDQMVADIRKRKIPVVYQLRENDGRGELSEAERFEFYQQLENFLHKALTKTLEASPTKSLRINAKD